MKKTTFIIGLYLVSIVSLKAQYQNIKINRLDNNPEEMTIAVNPLNPDNLAAGANINSYFYSTDGGLNWYEGTLSSQYGVWGDPCVLFDNLGNLYYAHLSNPSEGDFLDRIVVQKSTDGGKSWNSGVGVGLNGSKDQDKEWLAVDRSQSLYKNNLYMCWTEFDAYGSGLKQDSSRILFSYSRDQGESWSRPLKISDSGGDCLDDDNTVEGAVPAIGPDGQIYVSWSGPTGILFDKSLDGGQNFGKDIFVAHQPGGWAFDIPGISRCNGLPVTLCDISNSNYRGMLYVLWSDQRNGSDDTDVFLSRSEDEGENWSLPIRVNNDSGKAQQFFPWASIDPQTGYIYVVFYDRRNSMGNETEVYLAKSSDGGQTFSNYKISESPFTPNAARFFGDYINVVAWNGKIYPIWMRLDLLDLSAWIALIEEPRLKDSPPENPTTFLLEQNFPNPFGKSQVTEIRYQLPTFSTVHVEIYNMLGQKVKELVNDRQSPGIYHIRFDAGDLTAGVYIYRLTTGRGYVRSRKMILLR